MILYRTAKSRSDVLKPSAFWSDDRDYPKYVHPDWPLYKATLDDRARVVAFDGSPSRFVLDEARRSGVDVAFFEKWDWPGREYVVFATKRLSSVRRVG